MVYQESFFLKIINVTVKKGLMWLFTYSFRKVDLFCAWLQECILTSGRNLNIPNRLQNLSNLKITKTKQNHFQKQSLTQKLILPLYHVPLHRTQFPQGQLHNSLPSKQVSFQHPL